MKSVAPRLIPKWVSVWLMASATICAIDVSFTMLRPISNDPNNPISYTLYYGWNLYASVDVRYADTKDLVTCSTGRVMLIEIVMNFIAVWLARRNSRHAILLAFTTSVMVFWKTVWFLSLYVRPPPGNPPFFFDGKSNLEIFLIFWIPNGVWIVVPFAVILALWNKLALPVHFQNQYNNYYEKAVETPP